MSPRHRGGPGAGTTPSSGKAAVLTSKWTAAAMAAALVVAALATSPMSASAAVESSSASLPANWTISYLGYAQHETVPAGVTTAVVTISGAAGGTGVNGAASPIAGGKGASIQGVLAVAPGDVLTFYVGGQGGDAGGSAAAPGGWGDSTSGGAGNLSGGYASGGGGGASTVLINGQVVAVAGGGGGGGGGGVWPNTNGGAGGDGGQTPGNGHDGQGAQHGDGGAGGGNTGSGDGADGISGSAAGGSGGAGGGGVYGGSAGGGASSTGTGGGGGGAGASLVTSSLFSDISWGTNTGNGVVTVDWVGAPTCPTQTQTTPANAALSLNLADCTSPAPVLSYAITSNPVNGALSNLNASTGTLVYTPSNGFYGTDSFSYTATSAAGASEPVTVYVQVGQRTVTFNSEGGSAVAPETVFSDQLVPQPPDPSRVHYTFAGWYAGSTAWDFATDTVSSDIALSAKWTPVDYTVNFLPFNGTTGTTLDVAYGQLVPQPTDPTRAGYTFTGWYYGNNAWNFSTNTVFGNIILTGKWTPVATLGSGDSGGAGTTGTSGGAGSDPSGSPAADILAYTGSNLPVPALIGGFTALLIGLGLLVATRRRRRSER